MTFSLFSKLSIKDKKSSIYLLLTKNVIKFLINITHKSNLKIIKLLIKKIEK